MGIPAYFSYIIKNNKQLLKVYNKNIKIHHLLLDCNSIIYDCINNNLSNSEIIKNVCIKIEQYIKDINPCISVFIAFDGPPPVAKLNQQRERRYKNWITHKLLETDLKTHWNTANITPGTEFMSELSKRVTSYFENYNSDINILVSTSEVPGEGEHKLCNYIRSTPSIKSSNIIFYGLDADLIMLSLIHVKYCKNIYIYRETPQFIKHLNSSLDPNKQYILNISIFKTKILETLNTSNNINSSYQKNRIYDYILLCFLLGNDFLPHFPALNLRKKGMTYLLDAYDRTIKHTTKSIIYNNTIQWPLLHKFLKYLIKKEKTLILHEYKNHKPYKTSNLTHEQKLNILPQLNTDTIDIINVKNDGWETRYYEELFMLDNTEENIKQISINYLEGLEWVFKYYTIGCINWRWHYKYNYPPLLNDLCKYIPNKYTTFIKYNTSTIHPIVQLAYVLPKDYLHLLPYKYNTILQNHPDLYKTNYLFIWAFCKYFWEAHLNLPNLNVDYLVKILKI